MPDEPASPFWPDLDTARKALREGKGDGVRVAVIDSGIDLTHSCFEGVELEDDIVVSCEGANLRIDENRGVDAYGHGTAVASLLLSEAPGIRIGSFRALDSRNHARSFVIAECVNQAISRGYQVVNCSFGCRGLPRYVMDYKEWVDAAYLEGVHIVAACSNVDSSVREWPSFFPSVISVGGIDCKAGTFHARRNSMVSLFAKGERIEVPWRDGETRIETGSSYAAPQIAGKLARLVSKLPGLEPDLVKPLLHALASPLDSRG